MNRHVLIAVGLFVAASVAIVGGKRLWDRQQDGQLRAASDFGKVSRSYRLAVDSWVGYSPLCGDELARRLADHGIGLECIDDNANYRERFARLRDKRLDLAVSTVDAYLREQQHASSPGPIVAVIDESAGGDAIVARADRVASLQQLANPPRQVLTLAYTPDSPSEFLMLAVGQHFGIDFSDGGAFQTLARDGSGAALAALQSGKADIAVLWEPDVSKALADKKFHKLIGSEDTAGLIVDVLLASKQMIAEHEKDLRTLLQVYFEVLNFYDANPARRDSDIAARLGVPKRQVAQLADGVRWVMLAENGVDWFPGDNPGQGRQRLLGALRASNEILVNAGLASGHLSASNVLTMIWSDSLASVFHQTFVSAGVASGNLPGFAPLDDSAWDGLKEVGTLKVEPLSFQPGTATLTSVSRKELDRVAEILSFYPRYRLRIRGHTADIGDAAANVSLSERRAAAVLEYLVAAHRIDDNRIRAEGFGGSQPLVRRPGESLRSWRYRLPRVELSFVGERR